MRNDLTDVTLIVDRSGSMASRCKDAEGGINTFISDQKKVDGDCLLTLIDFDDRYEVVYSGNMENAPQYTLKPRGWTALLDAVGKAINETGTRLKAIPETERPGCVIFVIVTDGKENSSKEFVKKQIFDMITHQREKYNWQFTFLGADEDAFKDGVSLGMHVDTVLRYDPNNFTKTYAVVSNAVMRSRNDSLHGHASTLYYTEKERKDVE